MPPHRAYGGVAADERQAIRRRRLLEAAFDLLAAGGADALTVTAVCRESGLTARYFYEHFPNRDALLDAIVDAQADRVIAVARKAAHAATGGPRDQGAAGVRALLDALEADPHTLPIAREHRREEAVMRMRAAYTDRLTVAFVEDVEIMWPGVQASPQRVSLAAALAIGGVLELIDTWLRGDAGRLARDELERIAVDFTIATGQAVLA